MAKAARAKRRMGPAEPLMADRLLVLFGFELGMLERSVEPLRNEDGEARDLAVGAKGRIEALGQMVRTLEKLLELKQLEALAGSGGAEAPDAEAERLAAELMRRLRVLDRRRRGAAPAVGAIASAGAVEAAA